MVRTVTPASKVINQKAFEKLLKNTHNLCKHATTGALKNSQAVWKIPPYRRAFALSAEEYAKYRDWSAKWLTKKTFNTQEFNVFCNELLQINNYYKTRVPGSAKTIAVRDPHRESTVELYRMTYKMIEQMKKLAR